MSVEAFTVNGKVTLDIQPFTSEISKLQGELNKLGEGLSFKGASLDNVMMHFTDLKKIIREVSVEAEKINTAFKNLEGIQFLIENLNKVKQYVAEINGETKQLNATAKTQVMTTQQRAKALADVGKQVIREGSEIKKNLTYEEEMLATEKLFQEAIGKEIADKFRLNAEIEKSNELYMINREIKIASANAEKERLTFLTEENGLLQKITGSHEKSLTAIEEELAFEREKVAIIEEENALINEQGSLRQRNNTTGNRLDKASYLPARIGSMAVTMWGFNEIIDIYDKSMQNLNAYGSQKTYEQLMKSDNRYLTQTKQDVGDIDKGVKELNKSINETYKGGMSLQKMYQKVDMQSVGANAMDTAFKYGVQAENLDDLSEVMAIYGSEFVRQGRSQEDSILAVNDALDGEIRRLKEVGIDREDLEAHGWEEGDTMSMIKALREIAEERGYDVVAQKVTNLSDAITVLEIRIAQDLVGAFRTLEPFLTEVANDFIYLIGKMEEAWVGLSNIGKGLKGILDNTFGKDNVNNFGSGLLNVSAWVVTLGVSFAILYKIVKGIVSPLKDLLKIGKEAEDIGGAVAKDTGGIAKTGSDMGFKEGFKSEFNKLGKNLGKMARVFLEVVIAMAGAFLLIEEAILLISTIGYTYQQLKPQFDSGIQFIKEYGLMIALFSGAMLGLSYLVGKVPDSAMEQVGKGAYKVAMGMAIAIGLVAEAIGLLILPLGAIALVGGTVSFLGDNFTKGVEVMHMFADALTYIANDDTILTFITAFAVLSVLFGASEGILTEVMIVGVVSALGVLAIAIGMLIAPLGAIALLGGTASALGEENIQKGADTIELIGECLKTLEPSIRNLLLIDLEVFGVNLVDWGNKLITGKTGLDSLVQDILPNLIQFVKDFNLLDFTDAESVDADNVQMITQMATDIPPLFTAMQNLNNAMGTTNLLGNMWGAVGGGLSGKIGMGLKSKLDQLYNDVKDVMDFATKLGKINGSDSDTSAVTQVTDSVTALKTQLDLLAQTISTASVNVNTASKKLGSAIKVGFKDGASGFSQDVVSVLAKGISEVQQRYDTWHSGGEASAQKLADGFNKLGGKLKQSISTEMGYALKELDNYKDDFYNKGAMLGEALVDGFKSKGALDQNSPAKITKSIREELGYSMEALNSGRQMMYQGGVALGQALVNGYNSNGNLRTNVDVLAQKGVSNEQLKATARNIQANTNKTKQVPQISSHTINIDMSNSTVIGVQDLDAKIRQAVEKAIVNINSPNGAIGY